MSRAYYNDNDPHAVAWIKELIAHGLIAPGDVDGRSIHDVRPADIAGYTQCHFFAGVSGWSYALRLAGWPDDRPVWTGSCPCQPFSSAARGRKRSGLDLWPEWFSLISAVKPTVLFGEEVPSESWTDRACDAMEGLGYSFGAAILPACCVGADHVRYRLFFVCDTNRDGESVVPKHGEMARVQGIARDAKPIPSEDGLPGRVVAMRGYGNSIAPQLAAEFIQAYLDARSGA